MAHQSSSYPPGSTAAHDFAAAHRAQNPGSSSRPPLHTYPTSGSNDSSSSQGHIAGDPSGSPTQQYPTYAHYDMDAPIPRPAGGGGAPVRRASTIKSVYDSSLRGFNWRRKKHDHTVKPQGWTEDDEIAEREFLAQGMFNWKEMADWRFWIRKEWWYWYVGAVILTVLVVLMTVYHDQIVEWLTPATNWMKNLTCGWLIPIAVMFVISFPPLFGHEIVAILCGIVWGLWVGFAIVAAGTFLGEVGNFYAFMYCLSGTAAKYEKKNMSYACLAHVVRHGGFMIIVWARLSAIPGHFTTAVFATCRMNIWIFCLATILTMPKQLITVYLGVIFVDKAKNTDTSGGDNKEKIISYTVLAVGVVITIWAAWYIYAEMNKARVLVWRKQRARMAAKGIALNTVGYHDATNAPYNEETVGMLAPPGGVGGLSPSGSPTPGGLRPPSHQQLRQSYVNPYDIKYKKEGDMSVYHLDTVTERIQLEEDVASHLAARRSPPPQGSAPPMPSLNASFPTAQPVGANLRRDPSTASTWNAPPPQAIPSTFPQAAPHRPQPPPQGLAPLYEAEYETNTGQRQRHYGGVV